MPIRWLTGALASVIIRTMTHAAFILVRSADGWAATTRPDGRVGLPGGKVEPGESPIAAALREAAEEGWLVRPRKGAKWREYRATVDGRPVVWFYQPRATAVKLASYKEASRGIRPVVLTTGQVAGSGFGNRSAVFHLLSGE